MSDLHDRERPAPTDSRPSVTIGMPTHNGARYLAAALEALLAQDHADFELVVSDNCSTDATPEILQEFVERDPRVHVERSDEVLTAAQNFNRVFDAGRGAYFMWAADDDLWHPSYLRRCLDALRSNPEAVMACTSLQYIDPAGRTLPTSAELYDNPDLSAASPVERARRILRRGGWYQVYGVARRSALQRTHLFQDVYGPDVVLVLELALLGPIVKVAEPLFFYRKDPKRAEAARIARQGGVGDPDAVASIRMTRLAEALSAAVSRSGVPMRTRARLRLEILRAAYLEDTPLGRVARKELPVRIRLARRDGDVTALAAYGALHAVLRTTALARRVPSAVRDSVRPLRRRLGRLRRRVR